MKKKEKYKYLREAGYSSKDASAFSSLGKEKFLSKLDKKGSKRIEKAAEKQFYKEQRERDIERHNAYLEKKYGNAWKLKNADIRAKGSTSKTGKDHFNELGYKLRHVYTIKLKYESGETQNVIYETDRNIEDVKITDIEEFIYAIVESKYMQVLDDFEIIEILY